MLRSLIHRRFTPLDAGPQLPVLAFFAWGPWALFLVDCSEMGVRPRHKFRRLNSFPEKPLGFLKTQKSHWVFEKPKKAKEKEKEKDKDKVKEKAKRLR